MLKKQDYIEYNTVKRTVIGGVDKGKEKYYASQINAGKVTLKDLSTEIQKHTTFNAIEIQGVVGLLVEAIVSHLKNGNTVELGDLGTFRVSISSRGEKTKQEVISHSIKGAKILYAPSSWLKDMLKILKFKKRS